MVFLVTFDIFPKCFWFLIYFSSRFVEETGGAFIVEHVSEIMADICNNNYIVCHKVLSLAHCYLLSYLT